MVLASVTDGFHGDSCFNGHWIVGDFSDLFRLDTNEHSKTVSGEHLQGQSRSMGKKGDNKWAMCTVQKMRTHEIIVRLPQ